MLCVCCIRNRSDDRLLCFADAFSLVTDSSGRMTRIRLDMFVQELLILPAAVFESPSFEYTEGIARTLFDQVCFLFHNVCTG